PPCRGVPQLRGAHGPPGMAGGARARARRTGAVLPLRRDAVVALPPPPGRRAPRRPRPRGRAPPHARAPGAAPALGPHLGPRRTPLPLRRAGRVAERSADEDRLLPCT